MLCNALGLSTRFVQLSGVLRQKMGWTQRLIYQAFALYPKNACLNPCLLMFWCRTPNVIVRWSPPHLDTHTSISKTQSKLNLFSHSYSPAPLVFERVGLVPARSCLPKTLSHLIPAELACAACAERTPAKPPPATPPGTLMHCELQDLRSKAPGSLELFRAVITT